MSDENNWSKLFNALPEDTRIIGVAMELKTRIQQLSMEKMRIKSNYLHALLQVDDHMNKCVKSLTKLEPPKTQNLTPGWTPSHNDPDNCMRKPSAEPMD